MFICVHLWLISLFVFTVQAQIQPVYDRGAVGLGQLLKRLNNTKSVMMIAAHPDDEDSDLLAYLARAENARTVYLSLTRGDGGQNVIGPELFESLGVIRTEELLQARTLDGGEQLFTRAFDYGFSKTLTEAKAKWNEEGIKCDVVRAIRTVRPLVVISRFSGTPNDGHGQHQFAGYISPIAVKAAADANQCKDLNLPTWQVLKFYVSQGFRDQSEPTLKINTGKYDFLLGRSYYEIAAEGRSQHKTQEQGGLELKGDRFSGVNLVWSKVSKIENEKSIFDGIDISLGGMNKRTNDENAQLIKSIEKMLAKVNPTEPTKYISDLLSSYKKLDSVYDSFNKALEKVHIISQEQMWIYVSNSDIDIFSLGRKQDELKKTIKLASGLQIDALANQETVTKGETFLTSVKVFYPDATNIKVKNIQLKVPNGWQVSSAEEPKNDSPFARFFRENANDAKFFNVKVASDAKPTQPYFFEEEKENYLYKWNDDAAKNKPFQDALMSADVTVEIDGTEITFNQLVEYRYADDIRGELRRNLNVVPKVSLKSDQDLLVIPNSDKEQTRKLILNLKSNSAEKISGTVDLKLPKGFEIKQDFGTVQLNKKGESKSFAFDVVIPANAKAGNYEIQASMKSGEEVFSQTLNEIAYPHIQTHRFYTDAKTKVEIIDLKVAPVKVGYIMGSGDSIPEAIRQMGLNVELLDENDLTNGDFFKFDVVVVGIRASEVNQSFVANNQRLLDYVKNGGTLIVQYQKNAYLQQNLAPFPATMASRVAEEDAKITILESNHPVFNFPNKITQKDFENWVQERNLYAFTTFDEKYTPLLEAHDTGEPENKGGMVYAEIGNGKYMYVSYAFFRQLPAGVSGAYRLFANILSLPKAGNQESARE
ncbi:MAG: PIG-L family deacetylase [Aridibacter sp.]